MPKKMTAAENSIGRLPPWYSKGGRVRVRGSESYARSSWTTRDGSTPVSRMSNPWNRNENFS